MSKAEEARRDKQRHIIYFLHEFVWGGFLSILCLGLFALLIYVAGLLGVSPPQQLTLWLIGCSVATIVWFIPFLGNVSMRNSSMLTYPALYLSWSVMPALFFIGTWMFYL